jgi:hypothetical protein
LTDKPRLARRTMAETTAASVLRAGQIEGLWVDPIAIAASKDIEVQAKPENVEGVSGMLVKAGDVFGIIYATNIPSRGFQRFSVAHELGHYFISGHPEALLSGGVHVSRAGFVVTDPYEQEADYFAAALLMPKAAFRRAIDDHEPGLACIQALREACETSLTATAIRYSALTGDGVAVIVSTGSTVDWCFLSDGMKQARSLNFLRKGTPVPAGTLTSDFIAKPSNVRLGQTDAGDGRLSDWFDGNDEYRVTEEVVGLGQYGRTLTVLSCKSLSLRPENEPGEDDEAQLIEQWTPRFRR